MDAYFGYFKFILCGTILCSSVCGQTTLPAHISNCDGKYYPDPGYLPQVRGQASSIRWQPGIQYASCGRIASPHVVAARSEGLWVPEDGYNWDHMKDGKVLDFSVSWQVDQPLTEWPHVFAGQKEGTFRTEPGYVWVHLKDGKLADYAVRPLTHAETADADCQKSIEQAKRAVNPTVVCDAAIEQYPGRWQGPFYRSLIFRRLAFFDLAKRDLDRADALVDANLKSGRPDEDASVWADDIRNAKKDLDLYRSMEVLWVSYLKEIQAAGDYQNWQGPPFDLYVKNHPGFREQNRKP